MNDILAKVFPQCTRTIFSKTIFKCAEKGNFLLEKEKEQ